ncbi:hypothetical protein JNW89_20825, partial [Micromonospora sp. 4G55]|nr:hypothetical protein [Micromonospora sp. 4G55]
MLTTLGAYARAREIHIRAVIGEPRWRPAGGGDLPVSRGAGHRRLLDPAPPTGAT